MVKLREINAWHQLVLNVVDGIIKRIHKLVEVLFVEKNLVFFIRKAIIILVIPLLAFGDGQVVIIGASRLNVEEIRSFPSFYFLRENLIATVFVLFHKWVV